jgi:hypothetical protein
MIIVWHGFDRARSWLTVGYAEGRWSNALPINGNQSLGVTKSPPLGSGHHHVGIMASADQSGTAVSGRIGLPFPRVVAAVVSRLQEATTFAEYQRVSVMIVFNRGY